MELEPEAGDVDRDTELEGDENEDEDDEVFEVSRLLALYVPVSNHSCLLDR